jgi:GPN-loop GTPase
MSKYGVMVMGPAGAGKVLTRCCNAVPSRKEKREHQLTARLQTSFCAGLVTHLHLTGRSAFYVNLDPAAEDFEHAPDLDIKDLISVEDVMEEMGLGPNGALIYCFEFLVDNLDWLQEQLESLTEDYLVIFDMPGQIELYTHVPVVPQLAHFLTRPGNLDMRLCAAYLVESMFTIDRAKFFSATLSAMSCMVMMGLPHINIMSKMDLVKGQISRRNMEEFLAPDETLLEGDPLEMERRRREEEEAEEGGAITEITPASLGITGGVMQGTTFSKLNHAVARLVEEMGMVKYHRLDVSDEETVEAVLSQIDYVIQFQEAQEPKEPKDEIDADLGD